MPRSSEELARHGRNRMATWRRLGIFKREVLAASAGVTGTAITKMQDDERSPPLGLQDALFLTLEPEELGAVLSADAEEYGRGRVVVTVTPRGQTRRPIGPFHEEMGHVYIALGKLQEAAQLGASQAERDRLGRELQREVEEAVRASFVLAAK